MSDGGDCGGDTGYSYDGGDYTCNDTTTDVVYDDGPTIESSYTENNFYIGSGIGGGCHTIYDGGFAPVAPVYNVGLESISFGGGIQPCYDTDFHTIAVGVGDPCYVEPHVYPVYPTNATISPSECVLVGVVLTTFFVIFIIMVLLFIYL